MRCANAKDLFSVWRDGGISDAVKDQLVTHLESCPHCAEAWAGYNEALDALQSDTVEVPDSFRKGWRSRVAAAGSLPQKGEGKSKSKSNGNAGSCRPVRRSVFMGGGLVPKLAAAAALIVVIGLSVVFGNNYLSRPPARTENDGAYEYNMMLEEDQAGGMMMKESARGLASVPMPSPQISAMPGGANATMFSATAQTQVTTQQRKIIRTAQITIETGSVEETCNRIEMLAISFGGYVQQSSILRNAGAGGPDSKEQLSGSVQIAVPSEMFDQILNQLPDLGKVLHKNVSGQDVTEEYVDLEARLKNWRFQEDQLNLIMTKARNVEEILAVQNELGRVREEIERLTGRLQYLQRRTDFADLYFTVVSPGSGQEDPSPSPFIEALRRLGRQLWESVAGLLSFIVTLAPWIAFGGVVFLAGRSWWRKRDL